MNTLIDFRKYDGVVGGVERMVIEVTRYLASQGHSVTLLPKSTWADEVRGVFSGTPNVGILPLAVRSHAMSARNVLLDSVTIQAIARRKSCDAIHFPYNWSFPLRKRAPCLLTVHDVIPLTFREAMGLLRNLLLYRRGMQLSCRLNDVIVTVSAFSKRDIASKLGVSEARIRVIPNGIRDPFPPDPALEAELLGRYGLQDGFLLNVGGIHERKNVPRLIAAFGRFLRLADSRAKLVVTGRVSGAPYQDKMKKACDRAVAEAGLEGRIVFTGFIPDQQLDALMRRARCLIYPSLYEGFGIPVLEAMRVGTPVITSRVTALPEVAGEAALLVDPRNVEEMAAAMQRLDQDESLRMELIRRGGSRAAAFTWERTAEAYLALYQELVERGDGARTQSPPNRHPDTAPRGREGRTYIGGA